jgi:hypothetical protein
MSHWGARVVLERGTGCAETRVAVWVIERLLRHSLNVQQLWTRRKREIVVSISPSVGDGHARERRHRVGALEGLYLLLKLGCGAREGPARYGVWL